MTDQIDIRIRSTFDSAGTQAAQKGVADLVAAIKAVASGKAPDLGFDKSAAAAAKASTEVAKLATQQQRTALTANQAATAAQKLATEEQRTAAAASNAAAAESRAEKAALSLAAAQQKAGQAAQANSGYFDKMGASLQSSVLGIIGPAAIATTAIAALKGSLDLAQAGASIQSMRGSFENLAITAGTTSETLLAKMRAAAEGTVSDAQLMESANSGLLLTSGKIANDLPKLLEIARASSKATGEDVGFVFDSLVKGIARGSPQIIDNAKITFDSAGAFETYAKSIGKSADELTRAEQQQATLNAVLAAGPAIIEAGTSAANSNAQVYAQAGTQIENAKNKFSELLADGLAPVAGGFGMLVGAIAGTDDTLSNVIDTMFRGADGTLALAQSQIDAAGRAEESRSRFSALEQQTMALTSAMAGQSAAMQEAAAKSVADTAAKDAQSATTALLQQQTKMAADAFLELNPNISQSGIASAQASGQISAAVAQYIQMTLAAAQARNQLAQLQAQAGMAPAVKAAVAANPGDVGRYIGRNDLATAAEGQANVAKLKERERQDAERAAAQRSLDLAKASAAGKVAIYQKEYDDAVRIYGAQSTQALKAETDLVQAKQSGATKRAGAAQAGADKLTSIEQKTGDKLEDIDRSTQDKLLAIDKKAAEERAAAYRKLQEDIATSTADRRASNEADDLDLVGKKTPEEAAKLNDRERAEADARRRSEAAAQEARAAAERGEAESAGKIYDIRQRQIDAQQQLDEKYYERQRELAGDPKAQEALKQQYDEATRANEEAAQARIDIANAEAAAKAQQVEDEKAQVIAAAEDQKNQVIAKAQESAAGVKSASQSARDVAVANLNAIASAVNNIPTQKTITITTVQSGGGESAGGGGGGGAAGGTKAAGGGTFATHGPTTLTVGDNPGGVEIVSVTPVSGRGATSVGPGMARLAGGGTVVVDAGDGYTTPIAGTGGAGAGARKTGKAAGGGDAKATEALKAERDLLSLMKEINDLRRELARPAPALNEQYVAQLADDGQRAARILATRVLPTKKDEVEKLGLYRDLLGDSVSVLKDAASLTTKLFEEYRSPTDAQILMLATDAQRMVRGVNAAAATFDAAGLAAGKDFAEAAGATFGAVKDGLLAIQALSSGDFQLNAAGLAQFEAASEQVMDTAARLGARAAQIPAADIAALQDTTAAIAAQAEAMIKVAAVPFSDLARGASAFGGGAQSGGGGTTIINVYGTPGMDVNALANAVVQRQNQRIGARR